MTTGDPSNTDGDKPVAGDTKAEAAAETKPGAAPADKKGKLGRNAAVGVGVGIGIGSAALVAALLYASRHKPGGQR
jgi:hypothetical protein